MIFTTTSGFYCNDNCILLDSKYSFTIFNFYFSISFLLSHQSAPFISKQQLQCEKVADSIQLLEACHIITAQLNSELTKSDLEILADDIDYFVANIPTIAIAISKQLEHLALILAKITTPDGTLQDGAPDISKLPAQATTLQESISNQTTSIAMTRMRITELGVQIHAVYRELFEVSVRIIEQTLHGSVARGGKARAEHLASVTKGMELKLQYVHLLPPYFLFISIQHYLAKGINPIPVHLLTIGWLPRSSPKLTIFLQNPLTNRPNPNQSLTHLGAQDLLHQIGQHGTGSRSPPRHC